MLKNTLSLLLALVCFTLIGCGGSIDMRALTERLDRAEARATAAEERVATLEERNEALLTGRALPEEETSGGEAERSDAPVAPIAGTAPMMTLPGFAALPVSAMPGVVPMCDGVDSAGMLASGMLTSSMAFAPGSEPGAFRGATGMTYSIANSSVFEIVLIVDGRMVHHFEGGFSPMQVDNGGGPGAECAAPVLPSRMNSTMPTRTAIAFVDNPDISEHTLQYLCYRSAGGRLATRPAARGSVIARPGGFLQIVNSMCGDPYNP